MIKLNGRLMLDILTKYGTLEWVRALPIYISNNNSLNDNPVEPYFIAWRYKDPNPLIEQWLVEAVKSFKGNVEWEIYVKQKGNRNWVIETKKALEYEKSGKVIDYSPYEYIKQKEPYFGTIANQDIPNLAAFIDNYLQEKLKITKTL